MAWITCQYTREQINAAGQALVDLSPTDPSREKILDIIGNWKSCHSFPLQVVKMTLKKRATKKVNSRALIAQRIKRLSSIAIKLRQHPNMKLSQMQDIGGCRAVLNNVSEVEKLVHIYESARSKNPKRGAMLVKKNDYISEPKPDGYRSVHLIVKFQSKKKKQYNNQKIEIQIRTKMQHAWATAVETCQTFTGQALKTKIKSGSANWLRFFALMGSAIAAREKRPLVPDTPTAKDDRIGELKKLVAEEEIITKLMAWNVAIQVQDEKAKDAAAFLLQLNTNPARLLITPFREDEMDKAQMAYNQKEKETANDPGVQVVLVSVDSVAALRKAYPNYYMDTTSFIELIREELGLSKIEIDNVTRTVEPHQALGPFVALQPDQTSAVASVPRISRATVPVSVAQLQPLSPVRP